MAEHTNIAGRYRIEQELARGGMGVVCRAFDTSTEKFVALKRLLTTSAANKHLVRLFQREYHTLVQLQHPRIIEVYDYGIDAQGPYYTMELLDGKDLRELAPLGPMESCRHLRDVASSLALLHARRLLHRDLTARNVRLTGDGRAKLLDFGALATFGITGQVVGTPPVVPPEALNGQPLDQRADLYALGALTYWLLTGRHAFPAQSLQTLPSLWRQGAPPPPSKLVKDIPRELDHLVMSLLSMDTMSRPSSAAEVIERLNVIAGLDSEAVLDDGHSYLSNPKIVGRERELDRVRRFLERVVGGHSASLWIEGESGVGKTRVLEEVGVEAQLKGATVLKVDAEIQRGPYAVVRALIEALMVALPDIATKAGETYAPILGETLPEVRDNFENTRAQTPKVDRSEHRVRVQAALSSWFLAVAEERPLVLAVDNAHSADEASLAFCAALPRRSPNGAIGIVVTTRTGEAVVAERTLGTLRDASNVVSLGGLDSSQTIALVRALFGDVENAGRLGQWLRDRTDGNPMQCLTMAAQLIADDHVRYKDGAWVLPSELSREQLPSGMTQVLARRVAQLGPAARRLAEAVSIERGRFSIEQCSVLAGAEGDEVFASLDELVRHGILVGVGDEYRFSQVAFQNYLREQIPEERKKELHRRAGEYLLGKPDTDAATQIDAGWHLLRAGEETRGADILAKVGSELVQTIEGLAIAAPGLEAALEVFEKQGRSKWVLLNVLEALTSAGWYVDRRYGAKYGERTLNLAMELSGLSLATKLAPALGASRAMKVGTLTAAARHALERRHIDVPRFQKFKGVFAPLIGTLGIMIGIAANSFDARTARKYLNAVRILKAFPSDHVVGVMYDYCRYFTYVTEGRLAEATPIGLRVLEWFKADAASKILGAAGAKALTGGQMTGIALYSALAGTQESLGWAKQLESLGLSFYSLMATQVRFVHHAYRGEIPKAAPYREQLELNAIQGGTTWQTSILVPFMLGAVYSACGELVRLRQSAEELERMATEIPSLGHSAQLVRASYHYWRGRPEEAISLLENVRKEFEPRRHVFWAFTYASYIRALLATGRFEEAVTIARRVVQEIRPEERRYGMVVLELEMALCLAEAHAGNHAVAAERLESIIREEEPNAVPMLLALLHETRARVAQLAEDDKAFVAHLDAMGRWARASENTALVAKWKRFEAERQHESDERALASSRLGSTMSAYASAVRTVLEQHRGIERAHAALRLIMENTNATRGYLYLGTPPNLSLAAQMPENLPPSQQLTNEIVDLAAAVHQSTQFPESADDLTGTVGLTEAERSEYGRHEFMSHLLVVPTAGQPKVVGAVALKVDFDAGERIGYDILEAIARSLSDINSAPRHSTERDLVT